MTATASNWGMLQKPGKGLEKVCKNYLDFRSPASAAKCQSQSLSLAYHSKGWKVTQPAYNTYTKWGFLREEGCLAD